MVRRSVKGSARKVRSVLALAVALGVFNGSPLAWGQSAISDHGRLDRAAPPTRRSSRRRRGRPAPTAPYAPEAFKPFELKAVRVDGSSVAAATLSPAWTAYLGRTVALPQINAIVDAVAAAYGGTDVALYAVSVADPAVVDGTLHLRAVESSVEAVDLEPDRGVRLSRTVRRLAQPLLAERPLRRSSLERLQEAIRDLPGASVEARVTAGSTPGRVQLHLALHQARVQLSAEVDNTGQAALGRGQADAALTLNSLLREGDQTQFTTLDSMASGRLRYYAVSHAEQVGDTTVTANFGYLRTHVEGLAGRAYSGGLAVSLPPLRTDWGVLTPALALDGVNVDNAFVGEGLESDHTRAVRVSLSYSRGMNSDSAALTTSFSRGLAALGARIASPAVSELAFTKLTYAAALDHAFSAAWLLRLRSQGQWSFSRLPSVEQFALGGPTAGRAFDSVVTIGDSGAYGSVELARTFARTSHQALLPAELYAFADAGYARYRARLGSAGVDQTLSSAGLGFRATLAPHLVLQLEGAQALTRDLPFHTGNNRVNAALRLAL